MGELLLKREDIEKIHETSLNILKNVGIRLYHDDLMSYISNFRGVKVNKNDKKVFFESEIIERSIKKAGKKFRLYGRDRNKSADFGYDKIVTSSSWGMPFEIDVIKNKKRLATIRDLNEAAILGDFLQDVDIVGAMFRPKEIPEYYRDVYEFGELIKKTGKPVSCWITNSRTFDYIIEIYNLFLGNSKDLEKYPPFFYEFENISPLVFMHDGVDILYNFAKNGMPVSVAPIPQPMATSPVTIAGSLALGNAELLAGLVLTQLIKPGLPFMYGLMCNVPDPITMVATFTGAPENALFSIVQGQIAHYYGFPIFMDNQINCANQVDYQAGLEFGINCFAALMLNADLYGHIGIVGADQGASLVKLIQDAEAVSYIKRIKQGFKIDQETLAYSVIKKVGIGGNFLLEEHTLEYLKNEYWRPTIFNRNLYTIWAKKGAKSLIDKSMEYKDYILKNHKADFVREDILKEIDKIVKHAREKLKE